MQRGFVGALLLGLQLIPWLGLPVFGPGPAALGSLLALGLVAVVVLCALVAYGREALTALEVPFAGALLMAAMLCTGMGLLQYFGLAGAWAPWISTGQPGEAYANLRQRNQFATLTNLGLVALLWWQASGPGGAQNAVRARSRYLLCLLMAACLAVGTAASNSRTGLLQLLLVLVCSLVWQRRALPWLRTPIGHTILVAVGAYAIAAWTLPLLLGTHPGQAGIVARLQDLSLDCQSRRVLWANVWHLVLQRPWLGWGWGELDYAHFITLYPGTRFCDILDNAHNLPLHLAVEVGLPMALSVCAALAWWVRRAAPWKERQPARQLAWSVLGLVGVHSLLEYPLWYGPFQMVVVLALLLLWQTRRARAASTSDAPVGTQSARLDVPKLVPHTPDALQVRNAVGLPVPWLWGGASAFVLALCMFAAFDYWRMSQLYLGAPQRAVAYRDSTLEKLQGIWLFADYVRFAELTTTPLQPTNAAHLNALALQVLHFSPEPKVVRVLIDSAAMLGQDAQAAYYQARFDVAFGPANR
ncbi:Wzy polymerase domain-containing protein [Rhodoferax sp.]|jgi:O-antigen ligase|uniref:PglL family O-oligosaccharyltransferase n=1 Tax=Rhodoferax sp. TaxID=50421 RepID=UPI0037830D91